MEICKDCDNEDESTLYQNMVNCSVCGEKFDSDIRFLNHMMEKHGFRNGRIFIKKSSSPFVS